MSLEQTELFIETCEGILKQAHADVVAKEQAKADEASRREWWCQGWKRKAMKHGDEPEMWMRCARRLDVAIRTTNEHE